MTEFTAYQLEQGTKKVSNFQKKKKQFCQLNFFCLIMTFGYSGVWPTIWFYLS